MRGERSAEVEEVLERARAVAPVVDEEARRAPAQPVSKAAVEALRRAGLYGVMTPRELGGAELPLTGAIRVFAEISRADGSAGWCLMAGVSAVAYFGAYCPDSFTRRLFAAGVPLVAGQFAPNGRGRRVEGGYRLSGRYQFGSGIHCAEWVGAGFLVEVPEGQPPPYLFGLVPREEARILGNWDVLGLEATASYDYEIEDAFVPEDACFLFATPTRHRGGPVYDLGVIAQTAAGHAGFAMGVARRALDELREISKTKVRMGAGSFLAQDERFLFELGVLESRLRSASAWVLESFAGLEEAIARTGSLDPLLHDEVRQATVHVTQEGADIARRAYLLAGTTALREGPLQRCFRDLHAGSQHFFASPAPTLDWARRLVSGPAGVRT